jgi:hypothetical protein
MNLITKKTVWTGHETTISKDEIWSETKKILSGMAHDYQRSGQTWKMTVSTKYVRNLLCNEAMKGGEQKVQIAVTWEDVYEMLTEISRQRCFRGGPTGFLRLDTRSYPGRPEEKQFRLIFEKQIAFPKYPRKKGRK